MNIENLRKLWLNEEAQDIAEYAVMLAVILVLVAVSYTHLADGLRRPSRWLYSHLAGWPSRRRTHQNARRQGR